jgi:hypothetical protein
MARAPPVPGLQSEDVEGKQDHMGTLLLVVLVLMCVGGLPTWNHSREWGYRPAGGLGLVLTIVLILVLLGAIPR